jgi:hypothetical protein
MTTGTTTLGRSLPAAPLLLVPGAALLVAANILHPMDADPSPVSRLEFATESAWIPVHLALALGFMLVTAGLLVVSRHLQDAGSPMLAPFATTATLIGGILLVTLFGALDGHAVSALAASEADPGTIRAAAIAEEAIDTGVAAMGTLAFFGFAMGALGIAISRGAMLQRWIGWAAIVIGAAGTVAGVMLLAQGATSFTINVLLRPVAAAGTLWFIALGLAWRKRTPTGPHTSEAIGTAS